MGNIHEKPLPVLVNGMRETTTYKLFNENNFKKYTRFIDTDIFGTHFFQKCTILSLYASIAWRIDDLEKKGIFNDEAVKQINMEVARETGYAS